MTISNKREVFLLFFGDVFFYVFSLWLALSVRIGDTPSLALYFQHLLPFGILFFIWFLVYYIAGLYEKHTLIITSQLPSIIFNAQIANSVLAVVFFYAFPQFGITPKTILLLFVVISFILGVFWRVYGVKIFGSKEKEQVLLIGSGKEMKELFEEVNHKGRYAVEFVSSINVDDVGELNIQEDIVQAIYKNNVKLVAIDFSSEKVRPLLPHLYNLMYSKIHFIDSHKIYEDVFNRIPLSLVTYSWFLENISVSPKFTYDFLKRVFDIVLSFILGVVSLIVYPFVMLLIKLDDGGKYFISQERVGHNNKLVRIIKFRTMSVDDSGEGSGDRHMKVTRVGRFLRASRIDELPQLWNVFFGDISLIGPRPELPNLVKLYEKEISFYTVRHLIKPGLSGWAQLYQKDPPKFGTDVDLTKTKLSYDLFYIKNRSFWLDIKIALKTVKTLLSRSGV
ncbi:MAG: exopolysaccharide biosynthesis polyprenyl glycosylphosphotransferase [Candidatus Zambryskibacteria bacterium]|nr:exopolysaccharide biosynthesis polyprenyl glycosylphosphotransferase [Candidatus Zambryskibacteria bacterium]